MSVRVDAAVCVGCGQCAQICPGNLLSLEEEHIRVRDAQDCWDCMACVKACPKGALSSRLPYSLADFSASLIPQVCECSITWTCTDANGNIERFTIPLS